MKTVKVLLVGIGGYGSTFVREILSHPSETIKLAGVVDPYPERCEWLSKLKEKEVPIFSSMEDFYIEKSADLAVISTPIFLHTQNILCALKNASNVLCEKPLCADENDIEILKKAEKEANRFVYIGYQWAFSEAITNLKKDISEGKFGELLEMKTLVLRPRSLEYFSRGVGWAGKIKTADGTLVYDSIANNSAAHYIFNMQFVMGDFGKAAEAQNISAELFRANNIENFDTSKIQFSFKNGAKATFIAAHPVEKGIEPIFEYTFEKGTVYFSNSLLDKSLNLMHDSYTEFGDVVAIMKNGGKINYGNPEKETCRKMYLAIEAILRGDLSEGPCGICASSEHTKLINTIQNNFKINSFKKSLLKEENGYLYADGLFERAIECYKDLTKNFCDFVG